MSWRSDGDRGVRLALVCSYRIVLGDTFVTDALLWSILLLALGLGLIALELLVPSGGVLGILAALAIIASIAVAFSGGWVTGVIMLVATMARACCTARPPQVACGCRAIISPA